MGKVVIAGISLILVVGVVIGVIATVSYDTTEEHKAKKGGLSAGMKSAQTLCAPTDYKETCMEALGPVAKKGNASPMDLVAAAFEAAMEEVHKAFNKSSSLQKAAKNAFDKLSMEGCQEMMDCARVELESAIKKLKDGQIETLDELLDDLNSLLSAVLSDARTCVEGIQSPDLKKTMESLLEKSEELTINGLAIVEEIGQILSQFNITIPSFGGSTKSRLLLGIPIDSEGFPTWFSSADRKLMADSNPKPTVVVAQDGSGNYKTIQEAINAYPKNLKGRYVIYVKEGVYEEYVQIPKRVSNVYMYGDGHQNTVIRGNKNFKLKGIPTMQTATFAAMGNGFMAKGLGFENIAGPQGHQAVALRVQSDLSIFYNCRMDGYQDTFYYQSLRSFYFDCIISGTIDFIFGKGTAIIQNSKIISRMPEKTQFNTVTADGRISRRTRTGLVIQNCELIADPQLEPNKAKIPSYLGRPWSAYSTTMVMESYIGDFLRPEGWMKWNETSKFENTCEYREYGNKGPGAVISKRVNNWPGFKVVDKAQAQKYTLAQFSRGLNRVLKPTGIPVTVGLA